MNTEREPLDQPAAIAVKTRSRSLRPSGRPFRWLLCAVVYGWAAASTHANLAPLTSPLARTDLAAVTGTLSIFHGPENIYPVLGVLAAVASTYILRRRRAAQLESMAAAER